MPVLLRRALVALILTLVALPSAARADAPAAGTVEPVVVVPGYPGYCPSWLSPNTARLLGLQQLLEKPDPSWRVGGNPAGSIVAGVPANRIYTWAYPERGVPANQQDDQCAAGSIRLLAKRFYNRLVALREQWGYTGKVDVLGLSLGAEITRYCVVDPLGHMPGCAGMIDDWVGIAPPSHGSYLLNGSVCSVIGFVLAPWSLCGNLVPRSPFQRELATAPDETPGDGEFTTLYSGNDSVIVPGTSSALAGAANWRMRASTTSPISRDPTHLTIGDARSCPGSRDAPASAVIEWAAYELLDVTQHAPGDGTHTCDVGPIPAQ